jgi:hypothetical protein
MIEKEKTNSLKEQLLQCENTTKETISKTKIRKLLANRMKCSSRKKTPLLFNKMMDDHLNSCEYVLASKEVMMRTPQET